MKRKSLIYPAIATIIAPAAHAAIITQDAAGGFGGADNWNNASTIWDNDQPASAGNDYISNARLVSGGNTTFAGDSLTLVSGGNLQLSGGGQTSTVNNLTVNAGQIAPSSTGDITLAGTLAVGGDFNLQTRNDAGVIRNLIITSTISGGNGFTINNFVGGSTANFATTTIDSVGNTFSGTWNVTSGSLVFTDATDVGDLASITVLSDGLASVGGDWLGNILSAESGSEVVVDSNDWTVNSLTAAGTSFAPGFYSVNDLNTDAGEMIFSGTGSITVVPEPSVALLGGIGLLGLLRRRR